MSNFIETLLISLVCVLSFAIGMEIMDNSYQSEIIERGYGLHCPLDGEFAWKGECDEN